MLIMTYDRVQLSISSTRA